MRTAFRASGRLRAADRRVGNAGMRAAAIDCSMASLAHNSTSLARSSLPRAARRPVPASSPRADACRVYLMRGSWCQGWKTIARGASNQRFYFGTALHPARFMSTKRARMFTIATAGALTLATAISAGGHLSTSPRRRAPPTPYLTSVSANTAAVLSASGRRRAGRHLRADAGHRRRPPADRRAEGRRRGQGGRGKAAAAGPRRKAAAQGRGSGQGGRAADEGRCRQARSPPRRGRRSRSPSRCLSQYGWSSSQFSCLKPAVGARERLERHAENSSSGAYGIPQALPGSQMASAGADWQTSAATQIKWGLTYIQRPVRLAVRRVGPRAVQRLVLGQPGVQEREARSTDRPPVVFSGLARRDGLEGLQDLVEQRQRRAAERALRRPDVDGVVLRAGGRRLGEQDVVDRLEAPAGVQLNFHTAPWYA